MGTKIEIVWSRLIPLKSADIEALENVGGVYRLSKKKEDGKYYVFFVGSTDNIKNALSSHISPSEKNLRLRQYITQGGDFVFRYAVVADKSVREAIEKQLYKHYIPEFNPDEPKSTLDIEANLN